MRLTVEGEALEAYGDVGGRCLLLHGAGEEAGVFAPQLRDVPGTWAVDLPGHGRSPGAGCETVEEYAALVLSLLQGYAQAPPTLGGHSMGGAIALQTALMAPERLRGLALIATGARLRVHPDLLSALEDSGEMPDPYLRAMVAPGADAGLAKNLLAPAPGVRRKDFLACNAFDVLSRLAEIDLPALVLVGEYDAYTPEKYARALAQALSGELKVIAGAGHMLTLEAPQAVCGALAEFLRKE